MSELVAAMIADVIEKTVQRHAAIHGRLGECGLPSEVIHIVIAMSTERVSRIITG